MISNYINNNLWFTILKKMPFWLLCYYDSSIDWNVQIEIRLNIVIEKCCDFDVFLQINLATRKILVLPYNCDHQCEGHLPKKSTQTHDRDCFEGSEMRIFVPCWKRLFVTLRRQQLLFNDNILHLLHVCTSSWKV